MFQNQTIAAIATGMTTSGIGVIRISGEQSLEILNKVFKPVNEHTEVLKMKTYQAHFGHLYDEDEYIDECIVLYMKGPKSYTGEDVVEIDCHGGVVVMKKVLDLVLKYGASVAEPGEFTKRAFLNGRMDLSQAEAVMDVIHSQNDFALKSSLSQLNGKLKDCIITLRKKIIYHIAFIESALDDPEHISLDGYPEQLQEEMKSITSQMEYLIRHAEDGRILKEGLKTVIIGKPNAGKSSLMNYLVGQDKAIVTDIPGTTRDILEESIFVEGIPLNMVDTAGIRNTEDLIEKIGVEKAISELENADLILYIVDSSEKLDENDYKIMELLKNQHVIALLNKSDLDTQIEKDEFEQVLHVPVVSVSIKQDLGMDEFYECLNKMFFSGHLSMNQELYITNARHKTALENAFGSLNKVLESIELQMPEDFFSIDLMDAYEQLGFIIGESVEEDLVNEIFSKFCTGK